MRKISPRFLIIFIDVLAASAVVLFLMKNPVLSLRISGNPTLNTYANYEFAMLPVALLTLLVIYLLAPELRLSLLNLRKADGPVQPSVLLGIRQEGKERWKTLRLSIGSIITLVTAAVMYFASRGKTLTGPLLPNLAWVGLFALMNAFIEEVIYRLTFATISENEKPPRQTSLLFGALVFGLVHYFGAAPSGVLGVILASFIGFFLTKSILETRGFFWAWLIHFLQDLVIIGALTFWS